MEYLKEAITATSISELLNNLGSIVTTQVDDRNIFAVGNFGESRPLGFWSDVVLRQSGKWDSGGKDLRIHGFRWGQYERAKKKEKGVKTPMQKVGRSSDDE